MTQQVVGFCVLAVHAFDFIAWLLPFARLGQPKQAQHCGNETDDNGDRNKNKAGTRHTN